MTAQILKIQKFSRIILIFIKIALIASIIAIIFCTLAWISEILPLASETIISDGGVTIKAPVLFKFGDTKIVMPYVDLTGTTAGKYGMDFWLSNMVEAVITLVALSFAKRVFGLLRTDGNPFRGEVVRSLKRLAVALLVIGAFTGAVGFVGAAIVWVLYLIFDYGCALKQESDTTL